MSEIKPCMNTECYFIGDNDVYPDNCQRAWIKQEHMLSCPKYRNEPKPEPWQPLNPDEYIIGCRDYDRTSQLCKTCCGSHDYNCKCVPCYRPKKKPETVKYAVIKFEINQEKHDLEKMIQSLKRFCFLPVSGEIIKEEIKK